MPSSAAARAAARAAVPADRAAAPARRGIRPDDLYRFRIATDPRLSPDGRLVACTVQTVAAARDGYRQAIWLGPADGSSAPRQLTLGARHDTNPRFSPDGRTLAFLSDRRLAVEDTPGAGSDREDAVQVHLLPLDGGEASRLTDLPRGVSGFEWSPDGRHLVVLSASRGATRVEDARRRGRTLEPRRPGEPPESDYHFIDRLQYLSNGEGFIYHKAAHLWLVDVVTGDARRLTDGPAPDQAPAWSPDGRRIAFWTNRRPDWDVDYASAIWTVDVETGSLTRITDGGRSTFVAPAWLPDGRTIAAIGHRFPAGAGSRNDVWLFAADGSDSGPAGGRDLSGRHDLMVGASMGSDLTHHEEPRLVVSADGGWITCSAPVDGSYELWRLSTADGELERLTDGRHYVSGFDARPLPDGERLVFLRSTPTEPADLFRLDAPASPGAAERGHGPHPERLSELNGDVLAEVELVEPTSRWTTVDGRRIQGWLLESPVSAAGARPGPLVVEIHGGPQTLYGWAPVVEFQVLAAAGMSVWFCNPRGSEGYGQDFAHANFRDWGDGPARDVLSGVDELVGEGIADPRRLGVTGGSYGGYLTNWIVGHDQRFAAALTCRSVTDLSALMLTGDLSGGEFGRLEFGASPWDEPDLYRDQSPLTYAERIRTPLLIQHAENDLRCTITQAEELFAILRTLRRPVRLMRVPGESHELTRSGTPFRRVENLVQVRDWFRHYLVLGRRGLPPLPRARAGK